MERNTLNILALDGGGSKGMVTIALLQELEKQVPGFLDRIDLFAGTSIGGANAAALASGRSVESMLTFYRENGQAIFGTRFKPPGLIGDVLSILRHIPLVRRGVNFAAELFYPKWSNAGLELALKKYFGSSLLLSETKAPLLMTAMKLEGKSPFVGHATSVVMPVTIKSYDSDEASEIPLYDAVLRSMSAPVYFQSHKGYVDGGMFANNPSMAAYAAAIDWAEANGKKVQINVLSIGTGLAPGGVENSGDLQWGVLHWAKKAFGLSAIAVDEFDSLQAQSILGDNFNRLNIALPHAFPLDDFRNLQELYQLSVDAADSEQFHKTVRFIHSNIMDSA